MSESPNIETGNNKVALVIDDLVSTNPWQPRGIGIYGTAELVERQGIFGAGTYLRIIPRVSWSWNIEDSETDRRRHKTVHTASA